MVSGGGRNGGDSVKWVGKALRAVGVEGVWAHIGVRMRGVTGQCRRSAEGGGWWGRWGGWRCSQLWAARWWERWQRSEGGAVRVMVVTT